METIMFYNENEENGYLSNYYLVPITIDGILYKSSEHYYQSQKTLDAAFAERIRTAETCDDAKNLGNSDECEYRSDWKTYRNMAMLRVLIEKFTQNPDLKKFLLDTGDAVLAECAVNDRIWGIGLSLHADDRFYPAKWNGQNLLGYVLMMARDSLRCI